MWVFEYPHGICGILLCRVFRFIFLNPFVLGIGNCSRIFAFRAAEQTSIGALLQWGVIAVACHTEEIGQVIDDVMEAIEEENPKLKGVLPKNYASPNLDKDKLSDVVDLFTDEIHAEELAKSKDLLGRTYEYCIAKVAEMEEREKKKQATK